METTNSQVIRTREAYDFNKGLASCQIGLNTNGASTKRTWPNRFG